MSDDNAERIVNAGIGIAVLACVVFLIRFCTTKVVVMGALYNVR